MTICGRLGVVRGPLPCYADRNNEGDSGVDSLSIVIPAYNEASRIPATLESLRDFLERPGVRRLLAGGVEIVVIDDGSVDGTAARVRDLQLFEEESLKIFSLPRNRGKGAAIREGFRRARGNRCHRACS